MPESGSLYDPLQYPWPVRRATVPGATVDAITAADPRLTDPFVDTARSLEAQGASLIISNCGFAITYDATIRARISVPVATSSLSLLPFLVGLLDDGQRVGILTFDAEKLTLRHLQLAWPAMSSDKVRLSGLEGTASWRDVVDHGVYDWDQLEKDSLSALDRLMKGHGDIAVVLVECCALCSFVDLYKEHAGVPVYDIVSLANTMIGGLGSLRGRQPHHPPGWQWGTADSRRQRT